MAVRWTVALLVFLFAARGFTAGGSDPVRLVRIATYNMHGGKGHDTDTDGTPTENLNAFKDLLQGEQVLCFQEVDDGGLFDFRLYEEVLNAQEIKGVYFKTAF